MRLVVQVKEITGHCPVYHEGDRFVLEEGYRLGRGQNCEICLHSLASLMPYYTALSRGVPPKSIGLCKEGDHAFLQCLDPCRYTGGGTVVFEVWVESDAVEDR